MDLAAFCHVWKVFLSPCPTKEKGRSKYQSRWLSALSKRGWRAQLAGVRGGFTVLLAALISRHGAKDAQATH